MSAHHLGLLGATGLLSGTTVFSFQPVPPPTVANPPAGFERTERPPVELPAPPATNIPPHLVPRLKPSRFVEGRPDTVVDAYQHKPRPEKSRGLRMLERAIRLERENPLHLSKGMSGRFQQWRIERLYRLAAEWLSSPQNSDDTMGELRDAHNAAVAHARNAFYHIAKYDDWTFGQRSLGWAASLAERSKEAGSDELAIRLHRDLGRMFLSSGAPDMARNSLYRAASLAGRISCSNGENNLNMKMREVDAWIEYAEACARQGWKKSEYSGYGDGCMTTGVPEAVKDAQNTLKFVREKISKSEIGWALDAYERLAGLSFRYVHGWKGLFLAANVLSDAAEFAESCGIRERQAVHLRQVGHLFGAAGDMGATESWQAEGVYISACAALRKSAELTEQSDPQQAADDLEHAARILLKQVERLRSKSYSVAGAEHAVARDQLKAAEIRGAQGQTGRAVDLRIEALERILSCMGHTSFLDDYANLFEFLGALAHRAAEDFFVLYRSAKDEHEARISGHGLVLAAGAHAALASVSIARDIRRLLDAGKKDEAHVILAKLARVGALLFRSGDIRANIFVQRMIAGIRTRIAEGSSDELDKFEALMTLQKLGLLYAAAGDYSDARSSVYSALQLAEILGTKYRIFRVVLSRLYLDFAEESQTTVGFLESMRMVDGDSAAALLLTLSRETRAILRGEDGIAVDEGLGDEGALHRITIKLPAVTDGNAGDVSEPPAATTDVAGKPMHRVPFK